MPMSVLNKSYVRIATLSILCLFAQPALSMPVPLTEDDVIQFTQKQSLTYQEIQNRTLTAEYAYELINSTYRLNLNFDYSLENDQTESTSTFATSDIEKTKKTLLLNKKFYTGTTSSLELTQLDYENTTTEYTQNYYTLSLEQNLFPYLFSNSEMNSLKAAQTEINRTRLQTEIDLMDAVKDVLSLYWRVQAGRKSVQENEDLLKKYERLVANVKRKKQNAYASAGEVEQALAEYESRKQTWQEDRNTLLTNLQQLKTALNIPADQQIQLATPKVTAKELPPLFSGDIKSLRRYQVQKLRAESAVQSYSAVNWKDSAKLSVYGKYTGQGLDADHNESWEELKSDPSDKYTIGVKLDYYFDDELSQKEIQVKRATQTIEVNRLARAEDDLKLQIQNARQKLENAYTNLQTTQNILKYRAEAVRQLTVTYGQGRTDINFLIDAFNKKIQAEVAAINAMGNYSTTLIEYQNLVTTSPNL